MFKKTLSENSIYKICRYLALEKKNSFILVLHIANKLSAIFLSDTFFQKQYSKILIYRLKDKDFDDQEVQSFPCF